MAFAFADDLVVLVEWELNDRAEWTIVYMLEVSTAKNGDGRTLKDQRKGKKLSRRSSDKTKKIYLKIVFNNQGTSFSHIRKVVHAAVKRIPRLTKICRMLGLLEYDALMYYSVLRKEQDIHNGVVKGPYYW